MRNHLTSQEMKEWAHQRGTKEFKGKVLATLQDTKDAWANQSYSGATLEETAHKNSYALGGVNVLLQVVEMLESMEQWEPEERPGDTA
jgi:hypothetical protein